MRQCAANKALKLREVVSDNLFFLGAFVLSGVLFFFVPQITHIWRSQIPLPHFVFPSFVPRCLFNLFVLIDVVFVALLVLLSSHPRDANPPQSKVRKLLSPLMQGMEFLISRLIAGSDRLTVGHQLFVGIGLVIFGCLPLLVGPTSDSGRWFWLAGAMCHNFSFWSIVAGIWFVLRSQLVGFKKLQPDLNQPSLVILTSAGRILAWLFMANVLGDALWLAACRDVISFRIYALWAILHIIALILVLATTINYLNRTTGLPVRVFAVAILVMGAAVRPAANSDLLLPSKMIASLQASATEAEADGTLPTSTDLAVQADAETDWYRFIEDRLTSIPEDEPVVIVFASGGGSRAAIFTALTLEFLARTHVGSLGQRQSPGEPSESRRSWADNIVLISAVSGGSLATAHFVARVHPAKREYIGIEIHQS